MFIITKSHKKKILTFVILILFTCI